MGLAMVEAQAVLQEMLVEDVREELAPPDFDAAAFGQECDFPAAAE